MMILRPNKPLRSRTRGQAMVEYVVILTALSIVLLIPYDDKQSVLDQLLVALSDAYKRFSYALSLPT